MIFDRFLVDFAWADLNPNEGGTIEYFTSGTAPNRRLIMNFNALEHYGGGFPVTTQVQLHEGSNFIEIHTTSMPSDGNDHTMGIENQDGTLAVTAVGRNSADWSASNDFVQFFQAPCGSNDAGVLSIDSPTVFCPGLHNIKATIKNFGVNQIDSVEVHWHSLW